MTRLDHPLTGVRTPRNVLLTRGTQTEELEMHTTTAQNVAHKNDIAWIKDSVDNAPEVKGHWFTSEYRNPWTGQTIRKSGRMQGQDWFIFDTAGNVTGRAHSLTWAKLAAA